MGFFPQTIAAALAGREVRCARLVECDFADAPGRYWEGGTGLLAAGGRQWLGTGQLATISDIETSRGHTASQVTLGLSGVDPHLIAEMVAAENNVRDRDVTIFVQYFDANWQTLDAPYAVYLGLMDVMSIKTKGPGEAKIAVTCEGLFTRRSRPPWGYLSDRSQQGLYPGDLGLSAIAGMRLATPFWPVF